MPDEKPSVVPPLNFIEGLNDFLKSYDYGCHMLDGLVERHLSGEDIVSQVCTLLFHDDTRAILLLIGYSDEKANMILHSDLINEDGRQKLSNIRAKYRSILLSSLRVGGAIADGEVNPISSVRMGLDYDLDNEDINIDITGYSGQREIFRISQDAVNFLPFAVGIIRKYSDFLDNCQKQGLVLSKEYIDGLARLLVGLQGSTTRLSETLTKYQSSENKPGTTTE